MIYQQLAMQQKYQEEYREFVTEKGGSDSGLMNGYEVYYESEICSVYFYKAEARQGSCFLVVPSLFNSPDILFIAKDGSLIKKLLDYGNIYLINWKEFKTPLLTEDLVNELHSISILIRAHEANINLVGHCLGGNLCIGLDYISRSSFTSLTLLTTPWDFSHFTIYGLMQHNLYLADMRHNCNNIPALYIRIMFFLMFPDQFYQKLTKYFESSKEKRIKYLEVERWLQSGNSMPKSLYNEIIQQICINNKFANNNWFINQKAVDISQTRTPTCIFYAEDDQIVPYSAILLLQKEIKNSILIKVAGGHISYLINPQAQNNRKYFSWLSKHYKKNI